MMIPLRQPLLQTLQLLGLPRNLPLKVPRTQSSTSISNRSITIPTPDPRGLGPTSEPLKMKKGRGRPSHLSLAQSRALMDTASGRQRSLLGALRVVKSPTRVPP
jgi:hypothetical protein